MRNWGSQLQEARSAGEGWGGPDCLSCFPHSGGLLCLHTSMPALMSFFLPKMPPSASTLRTPMHPSRPGTDISTRQCPSSTCVMASRLHVFFVFTWLFPRTGTLQTLQHLLMCWIVMVFSYYTCSLNISFHRRKIVSERSLRNQCLEMKSYFPVSLR